LNTSSSHFGARLSPPPISHFGARSSDIATHTPPESRSGRARTAWGLRLGAGGDMAVEWVGFIVMHIMQPILVIRCYYLLPFSPNRGMVAHFSCIRTHSAFRSLRVRICESAPGEQVLHPPRAVVGWATVRCATSALLTEQLRRPFSHDRCRESEQKLGESAGR